ncbi:hypothetical protein V8F20_003295 [Naviculisporaceae sp. PSN 640]
MGSRSRGSKAKTTKDGLKHPRLSALVQSSSISKRRSSAGDQFRDNADAKLEALDSLNNGFSVRRWLQNFSGQEDPPPTPSQMFCFGQEETTAPLDWVMVPTFPEKQPETWTPTSQSSTSLPDTLMTISPKPESMRPPALRPRPTSLQEGTSAQQSERASSAKRLSIVEGGGDTSAKRTRPCQNPHAPIQADGDRNKDDDGSDSDTTSKAPDQHTEEVAPALTFACPYYRLNPVAHQQCLNYKLNRIRDVKQHLSRKHYGATCYCPICFRTFPSINLRDDHIRCRSCVSKPSPGIDNMDAVSPSAQEQLKQRVDRTVSAEDQWHAVYGILFGELVDKRVDPYIRSVVRETLGMVRAFLRATGSKIIPRVLESSGSQDAHSLNFETIMHDVFDEVETHFDKSTEPRKVVTRAASARPTSTPAAKIQQTSVPFAIKSEKMMLSDPPGTPNSALGDLKAGYGSSAALRAKSNTFPRASEISSTVSSNSGDLSRSWPSYYFSLPAFHDPGLSLPDSPDCGYYISDSLGYSTAVPVAGFANLSPAPSEISIVYGTGSGLDSDYTWGDGVNPLAGVGSGFQDSGYLPFNTSI